MQRALWSALPTFFFPFFSCFLAPSQLTFGTPPAARRSPTSARVSRPLGMRHASGRSVLTDEQTAMLWESFATNRLPNRTELSSLAVITRLPFKTVRIWFQNARQRHRAATCATDVGAPATRTGSTDVGAPLTMTAGAGGPVLLHDGRTTTEPSWTLRKGRRRCGRVYHGPRLAARVHGLVRRHLPLTRRRARTRLRPDCVFGRRGDDRADGAPAAHGQRRVGRRPTRRCDGARAVRKRYWFLQILL